MCVSHSVPSSAIPWTAAYQASLSMGFSSQGYWSGLPFPSSGDLPHPGMELTSPPLADGLFITEPPAKPIQTHSTVLSTIVTMLHIRSSWLTCFITGNVYLLIPSFISPAPHLPTPSSHQPILCVYELHILFYFVLF